MIGTPARWLIVAGVALCGYFTITSNDINIRMLAFLGSVMAWQAHSVVLMWEADLYAGVKRRKLEKEIAELKRGTGESAATI